MLVFQDGSPHRWLITLGRDLDLIATMDDATGEVISAFLVEEGTLSSFRGLKETIDRKGRFCAFYTDRGSHYFLTSKAGSKVDKHRLTQVGRGPWPARHRAHPFLFPRGQRAHRAALR